MSQKITFSLSPESIAKACTKLDWYKKQIERRTEQLRRKIAMRIAWSASSGFSSAVVDDITNGEARYAEVTVDVTDQGDTTVIVASGSDAIFVEFGAGVYYNGGAGSSPHPKGAELGFTIGGYGKGNGAKNTWGFYEGGQLFLTHGTPARMPMYNGMREACDAIADIAREVFG